MKVWRKGRARPFVRWAGVGLCTLFAGAWLGSGWWSAEFAWRDQRTARGFRLGQGQVEFYGWSGGQAPHDPEPGVYLSLDRLPDVVTESEPRWRWWYENRPIGRLGGIWVRVPLWPLLVILAVPTALLWWRDTWRREPGLCPRCGYPRAGLGAGAVCPECGAGRTG